MQYNEYEVEAHGCHECASKLRSGRFGVTEKGRACARCQHAFCKSHIMRVCYECFTEHQGTQREKHTTTQMEAVQQQLETRTTEKLLLEQQVAGLERLLSVAKAEMEQVRTDLQHSHQRLRQLERQKPDELHVWKERALQAEQAAALAQAAGARRGQEAAVEGQRLHARLEECERQLRERAVKTTAASVQLSQLTAKLLEAHRVGGCACRAMTPVWAALELPAHVPHAQREGASSSSHSRDRAPPPPPPPPPLRPTRFFVSEPVSPSDLPPRRGATVPGFHAPPPPPPPPPLEETRRRTEAAGRDHLLDAEPLLEDPDGVDEGVIPTLVREVLSAGPLTDVSQAVDAIMVLCETPQHRSAVIACGGVEALAAMVMRREFGQPGQQSAAYTISRLAADAEQVGQAGGVMALVQQMKDGTPAEKDVAAQSLACLAVLGRRENRKEVAEHGMSEEMLDQVRRLAQWMKDTREENRQTPLYVPASGAGVSAAAPRPHRRGGDVPSDAVLVNDCLMFWQNTKRSLMGLAKRNLRNG